MITPAPGKPLWGNILIRRESGVRKTKGGIDLPENVFQGHAHPGTVIAIGSGSLAFDGSPIEIEPALVPGARVVFLDYEAHEVTVEKEQFWLVDQRQIVYVF